LNVEEQPVTGALSRLILDANDRGLSYGKMADQAVDPKTGTTISKAYLQRLAINPPVNPPSLAQVRALAVALRVNDRRVKAAAAKQWLEYEATDIADYDGELCIIVDRLAEMPESEVRRWRMMIEAVEDLRRVDD
jgi:hypothetical protein